MLVLLIAVTALFSQLIKRIDLYKDSTFKIEFTVNYKDLFVNLFPVDSENGQEKSPISA